MFLRSTRKAVETPRLPEVDLPYLSVYTDRHQASSADHPDLLEVMQKLGSADSSCEFLALPEAGTDFSIDSKFALSLFIDPMRLDGLADKVLAVRQSGHGTTLIVAITSSQLVALGHWLERRANTEKLGGLRLLVAGTDEDVARQLGTRLQPVWENNLIRMPISTEIENSPYRNFYVFSPEMQALIVRIRGFAENGVTRACLLGGPGSGKTSLAYYYYLARGRGRFVSINLAAENTGDKAAVKSLLCGHVSGAFPGAGARTGAFTHARDGVCFLDESHGIVGPVMEVLMEALDNGQYLPYGASAKQQLECALLYASNRSWEHLQNAVNLDEFTRIGAAVLQVPALNRREEDMIAVTATTLARLAARCKTWVAPIGLSVEAWELIRGCQWHGNVRGLIRTLESAFVDTTTGLSHDLIQAEEVEQGIARWEPKTHHSHQIYESNKV